MNEKMFFTPQDYDEAAQVLQQINEMTGNPGDTHWSAKSVEGKFLHRVKGSSLVHLVTTICVLTEMAERFDTTSFTVADIYSATPKGQA